MQDPLISADALHETLARDPEAYSLLDVQWSLSAAAGPPGRQKYAAGHLPGARFLDLETDSAAPAGTGGRHPLPDAATLAKALQRLGVRAGDHVLVYDGGDGYSAARAWWVLTYFGVRDVRVLDGGLAAWQRVGGAVESGEPKAEPASEAIDLKAGALPLLTADEVEPFLLGKGVLLDARAPERFRGEVEPIDPVAGHIPGAVNSPTSELARPDGTFRSPDEIRDRWHTVSRHGRPEGVAVYCGSGVTAAHHVLALARIGIPAGLYAGSWSEWITDPQRPLATGPTPR